MCEVGLVQANRIKELREDSDRTQAEVAAFLSVAQNTYCNYENGKRDIPIALLVRLAGYYGVNLEYILGLTDVREPLPLSRRYRIP